jgi:3-oxoacyl-[acyl-carrier protein] reductase
VSVATKKAAIVTGAGRGIGAAIARKLAAQGVHVAVNYAANRAAAEATVKSVVEAGGSAFAIQAAVQSTEDQDRLFDAVLKRFGRLDILVNNAGATGTAPIDQITASAIDRTFDVNVKGALLATQRAVKAFGPEGGCIVNISSALVGQPLPAHAIYISSKAAIEAITRVLAQELGAKKIRVNAVAPGATDTDFLQLDENGRNFVASRTALGRIGKPDDIAGVVAFLASDEAAWITGHVIGVDGGIRV